MASWRKWGNHGGGIGKDESTFPDLLVVGGLQTMDNAVISPGKALLPWSTEMPIK